MRKDTFSPVEYYWGSIAPFVPLVLIPALKCKYGRSDESVSPQATRCDKVNEHMQSKLYCTLWQPALRAISHTSRCSTHGSPEWTSGWSWDVISGGRQRWGHLPPPWFLNISAEYVVNRSLTRAFEILPFSVIQKVINLLLGLYIIPPVFCLCSNCKMKIH